MKVNSLTRNLKSRTSVSFSTEACVHSDYLRSDSKVLVMEAAQYWNGDDLIV